MSRYRSFETSVVGSTLASNGHSAEWMPRVLLLFRRPARGRHPPECNFKDPFMFLPEETLTYVDGLQVDSNWTNYRALIIRDVDLEKAYRQLRALPELPKVRHIGINVDNITLPQMGPSMTEYFGNARDYHITQQVTTFAVVGTPSAPTPKECEMALFAVSMPLLDVPSLQYVSYKSRYLPEEVLGNMNIISTLRFLRMTASELPTKVAISSPMLEVLEFTDNSAARATALVVQSKGLRSLEADASTVEFRADSASLECISLSNVQSVELPLICNPKTVNLRSCTKAALFLCRASSLEELFVTYMDDIQLRPGSSVRVLYIEESKNLTLVTGERPLDVLVLSDVEFAPAQPDIHAKRVWLEFGSVDVATLSRINLKDTTHLGSFCANTNYDQAVQAIRQRTDNNRLFAVRSIGSSDNGRATKRAWMKKHGYQSKVFSEMHMF